MESFPRIKKIESRGLGLSYLDWGNEGAPILLLLHGLHDHSRTFDGLIKTFLGSYHVVTPDLRGHGDSDWLSGSSYSQLDYLYDLHQLVTSASLSPLTLVGHSLGGAVVTLFAGLYPSLVSKLVVIEGMGLWRLEDVPTSLAQRIRAWVDQVRVLQSWESKKYKNIEAALERMRSANPDLDEATARHLTSHGVRQNTDSSYSWKYDKYTRSFPDFSIRHEELLEIWRQVTCEVLLVNARYGLPYRIGHDDTLDHFKKARLEIVEGAGHWTFHDQPVRVQELLEDFLLA